MNATQPRPAITREAPRAASRRDDVAVLGAGLAGRLIALQLARQGLRVALYDRGGPDGSSAAAHVAAAMLAPLAEAALADPLVIEMGRAALAQWPAIIASLPRPVFFQRAGSVLVWHYQDRHEAQQFHERLRRQVAPEVLAESLSTLDATALAALEPALANRFGQAFHLAGEGQLDNRMLLDALLAALQEAGVSCHWQRPVDLGARAAAAPGAVPDFIPDVIPDAALTIDCRGLQAQADWPASAGRLRGVRGEVLRVHSRDVTLQRPVRLLHPRYPLYIAPKPDGVFVVGATEIESDDASPASVRSALELLSALVTVHPGFAEARIGELRSHCRPTLPDGQPRIVAHPGLLQVNGLYRHGYLIGPVIATAASRLAIALLDHSGPRANTAADRAWEEAGLAWRANEPYPELFRFVDKQGSRDAHLLAQ